MALRDKIRKGPFAYSLIFLVLLLFFAAFRFPYSDFKLWALSAAGKKAGIEISASDVSLLFPLGLELEGLNLSARVKGKLLRTPRIQRIGLRLKLLSLLSDEKVVAFYVENGGKGEGSAVLGHSGARVIIDSKDVDISGLTYGRDLNIQSGAVTIDMDASFSKDILESKGEVDFGVKGLLLKGTALYLPEISADNLEIWLKKEGNDLLVKSVKGNVEGMDINGSGKVSLQRDVVKSGIKLKLAIDTSASKNETIVPLLGMVSGGAEQLDLEVSGTLAGPRTLINGKKVF